MNSRLRFAALLLLSACVTRVFAEQAPMLLRFKVEQSDLIVVAKVSEPTAEDGIAKLRVIEKLKGKCDGDVVSVKQHNTGCPGPANYVKDTTVLTFLHKQEGSYYTVDFESGPVLLTAKNRRTALVGIKQLAAIQAEPNLEIRFNRLTAWMVDRCGRPETRSEGLMELLSGDPVKTDYYSHLDAQQVKRLLSILDEEHQKKAAASSWRTGNLIALLRIVGRATDDASLLEQANAFWDFRGPELPKLVDDFVTTFLASRENRKDDSE